MNAISFSTLDLAVAIVTLSELTEEYAGWEIERNERCARFGRLNFLSCSICLLQVDAKLRTLTAIFNFNERG